jgi:excisionase family DNA binding protein
MQEDKLTFSINEAAALLGVGRTTVYELIRQEQLMTVKIGQRRLITRLDLDAFIEQLRQRPAA